MLDRKKKLYYHGYDESKKMFWADPITGCSPSVWARGEGWLAMALVDVLENIDSSEDGFNELKNMFIEVIDGMLMYQENGMWYQVVDQIGRKGNYLETSGTLMMSYSILKAVRLKLLPSDYRLYGELAFESTAQKYLRRKGNEILLGGICQSAGLGRNPDTGIVRDGTFEYYTQDESIVDNNGHGVAPLFMAYNELEFL